MADAKGLLVKVPGTGRSAEGRARKSFAAAGATAEPILVIPGVRGGESGVAPTGATWLRVELGALDAAEAWGRAHAMLDPAGGFGIAGASLETAEPDFVQEWPEEARRPEGAGRPVAPDVGTFCRFDDQDVQGGKAKGPGPGWNLGPDFSELADAFPDVGEKLSRIVIAHLDTGYDPGHVTRPANLKVGLQRSFVASDPDPNDATDRAPADQALANRGHGTGTLSLLAGNRLDGTSSGWDGFKGYVGGAPLAQIIPVRIADWVVRFTTGTMVQGIGYAREQGAHVLSMSMGGLASRALADAVNLAYDSGLLLVTAAGNNFAGYPTPKSIVFPARFMRVLAACGLMADGRPYAGLGTGTMQGNFGPASKMATALGAFTPNVPWAQIACDKVVDMDGAGTSAATPQVAAAAALWLAEHWDTVGRYPEPWMRIEAAKHALFASASKSTAAMGRAETLEKIGQGVMRARAALGIQPLAEADLRARRLPPATASWAWLELIFGEGVGFAGAPPNRLGREMLALELTQLAQRIPQVDEAIDDPDRPADEIGVAARNRYLEAALDHGRPSKPLAAVLTALLRRPPAAPGATRRRAFVPVKRMAKAPPPPDRRLRVFALDPSIAKSLGSLPVNQTELSVPWDDLPVTDEPLRPGPVGEYLEVVDVDPASDRVYEPVDLNDKLVLAQNGWPPSEGNPRFHQQMVYAVGMTTIRHFERALGRRALWAPRYVEVMGDDGKARVECHEVRRLRIYPHAFRGDNAYYSPEKKALLFGYFPANSSPDDATPPGSMVFSCLSSDIIAHEMSHALLDGLHRRFQEASNPDVPAFHEAFADIVALFQHFTVPELVRFEIGRARGDLSAANLLGGLAAQFGQGMSRGGPLRDYNDKAMRSLRYTDTEEAHDRGSILVFAVYEAFLNIVANRSGDLIRLASNGTGVLPDGALHPDLVKRLTMEACKTARHVLQMCIRALDYVPAVDITFGEYMRALVTADVDLVPDDAYGYRVAFLEAFRKRGILPRDVRTISEESLTWETLEDSRPSWLGELLAAVDVRWNRDLDRSAIFQLNEDNRWRVWRALKKVLAQDPALHGQLGLLPDIPRYAKDGSVECAVPPGETTFDVFSVRPARRIGPDGSFLTDIIAVIHQRRPVRIDDADPTNFFWFRGGATLVIDARAGREEIRYAVIKSSGSDSREERQRRTAMGAHGSALRSLYFGEVAGEPFAMMHADSRRLDHG